MMAAAPGSIGPAHRARHRLVNEFSNGGSDGRGQRAQMMAKGIARPAVELGRPYFIS